MTSAARGYRRRVRFLRSLLDTYGLPHRVPIVMRIAALMLLVPAGLALLWWLLPHTPLVVALLVLYVLLAVFGGLWLILSARDLDRPPRHNPKPPPSTPPPSTS